MVVPCWCISECEKKIHVFSTIRAAFHFAHNVQRPTGGPGFTAQWRHSHCPGVCGNGSPDAPPRSQWTLETTSRDLVIGKNRTFLGIATFQNYGQNWQLGNCVWNINYTILEWPKFLSVRTILIYPCAWSCSHHLIDRGAIPNQQPIVLCERLRSPLVFFVGAAKLPDQCVNCGRHGWECVLMIVTSKTSWRLFCKVRLGQMIESAH